MPLFIQLKIKYQLLQKPITLHCLLNMISFFVAAKVWPLSMDLSFVIKIFFLILFLFVNENISAWPPEYPTCMVGEPSWHTIICEVIFGKVGKLSLSTLCTLKMDGFPVAGMKCVQCITSCLARWIVFLNFYIWVKFNWMSKNRTIIHVCYYMQPVV